MSGRCPDFEAPATGGAGLRPPSLRGRRVALPSRGRGAGSRLAAPRKLAGEVPFPLLCGEGGAIREARGVRVEERNYGHRFMGIEGAAFAVDGQGVMRRI